MGGGERNQHFVNNFLITNPTTLILSSVVGGRVLKPKQYARLSNEVNCKNRNYQHTVEHVVQSTFQNIC